MKNTQFLPVLEEVKHMNCGQIKQRIDFWEAKLEAYKKLWVTLKQNGDKNYVGDDISSLITDCQDRLKAYLQILEYTKPNLDFQK